MNNKAHEISSGQIFIFVISAQISFGILSLGSNLAEKVGHDGWISILIGGLITSLIIYIMTALLRRFKNLSIQDINIKLYGKYLGGLLNLFIIFYLTYTTIMSLRLFTDVIKITAMKLTPGWALTSFIIIPVVYLSWYGLKYICRYSSFKILLLIIVILYYFLLFKYFRITFLQPVGVAGLNTIIKGAYIPFLSFMGYELLSIIYPHIKDKKNCLKFSILGNLLTMAFYIATIVFLTGFFGEVMLKQLQFPIFSLARAYRAPVLERLDLFFIALWFPIMGTALQMYYFSAYYSLKKLLKIEDNKSKSKILISVFTVFVVFLSTLPKDMIQLYSLLDYVDYMGTAYLIMIILCYLISFIKPGGSKNEKSA